MNEKKFRELIDEEARAAEAEPDDDGHQMPENVTASQPNRVRSKVLQVRLSDEEFAAVERAAERRQLPASTVARERLLKLLTEDAAPTFTSAQQAAALRAIEIVRASTCSSDPQTNEAATLAALLDLVPGGSNASDATFATVAPDIITGLANVAATLAEHAAERSGVSVQQVIADVYEAWRTAKIED